jgi:hypothetical protein
MVPDDTVGSITTMAAISVQKGGDYNGDSIVTLVGKDANDAFTLFNQINNPAPGHHGAFISAPGYVTPGTFLVHKGPTSGLIPEIVLTQKAKSTAHPIEVTITGIQPQVSTKNLFPS